MRVENTLPLPATDHLVCKSGRTAADRFAVSEWKCVAEVRVELVLEAVGRDSPTEFGIEPIQQCLRLIIGRRAEDRRIEIQYFPKGVIGFETQPTPGTLGE